MAQAIPSIIQALRDTTQKLKKATDYQWGHMGACNCGFLAQVVTQRSPREIHTYALLGHGDWSEQLNDYCPSSGLAMDQIITELLLFGFDRDDQANLERLSDQRVLACLPNGSNHLMHNVKSNVIAYFHAWAWMLEDQWADTNPNWRRYGRRYRIQSFSRLP